MVVVIDVAVAAVADAAGLSSLTKLSSLTDMDTFRDLDFDCPIIGVKNFLNVQPADMGWPTGYGKKLGSWARQQAWLLLNFFSFPVGHPMSAGFTL